MLSCAQTDRERTGGHLSTSGDSIFHGCENRTKYLYDLTDGRTLASQITLPAHTDIERVRFHGRQLWVQTDHPERVRIYDVRDAQAPQYLGEATAGAEEFRAQYTGSRRYTFGANLVSRYRLEAVAP